MQGEDLVRSCGYEVNDSIFVFGEYEYIEMALDIIKDIVKYRPPLNADKRLFVMVHEAWHCVLMHMLRRQTWNPKRFNVATDMEMV